MILCICIHRVRTKTAQIPWKIRSNSWENFTHYYLFTCCIIVNVIVWEIGQGKQAAGQSRAPGRVMWTKCLPHDTIQPMESTLRNSNEIICKHRNLRLQVPGKVGAECGLIVRTSNILQFHIWNKICQEKLSRNLIKTRNIFQHSRKCDLLNLMSDRKVNILVNESISILSCFLVNCKTIF